MDALLLSRIQFAVTIGYHIVFPTLTMGLALFLVVLEARERWWGDALARQAGEFWSRIFALAFGMGVVSGVVLSYEIGTNFGKFSEFAGPVVGPLMSYEVMSAFFLEAGFLGIMLMGRGRVGPRLHFFATCMVALGTLMSAFWILAANSWMHTPAGHALEDGRLRVLSWTAAIFNPSFPYRLAHMVTAAWLTTTFVVAAVGAWHVLQDATSRFGRSMLRWGLGAALLLTPLQILIGDLHGLNTLAHQPTKVAAMEGLWDTRQQAPLLLFAWPDQVAEENRFEVAMPGLASLILTHDWDGEVQGLKAVPPADRPPVAIVFWSFRLMVGCGLLMLGIALWGVWRLRGGRLFGDQRYLRLLIAAGPIGFVAVIAGWVTTEVGRQPWVVHGLMRTSESGSAVSAAAVSASLTAFIVVYALIFAAFMVFFCRLAARVPPLQETV